MHVVIVGAGEIGFYLAERLEAEDHDVTIVEQNPGRAEEVGERLDVQVIVGSGSHPDVLMEARIDRADFVAAVTEKDEINLLASLVAAGQDVETTVIRLQNPAFRGLAAESLRTRVGANLVIDPDADTADEILELVHATGTDEVYRMGGDLVVIGAVVRDGADVANQTLADIVSSLGANLDFLFGAITRGGTTVIPHGDEVVLPGDHVRVLCHESSKKAILDHLGVPGALARRIMVLGGGAIGSRLARHLEAEGAEVVLLERDIRRAQELAEQLPRTIVISGDVTDTELLAEEAIGRMDAVVAATGEDASNVLACAYAAAEGASFTVAVLHRLELLPLVARFGIDAALSPRTASANAVLRHIRGSTSSVATFLESDAEVDEIEVAAGSLADGAVVSELRLPTDVLLGAVIRPQGKAEIVRGPTILNAGDHVVLFARPRGLPETRAVFGVSE
ncbi:MAG: Trk system potassium transporter TrkA [Acidimicrobiales bacterium]